MDDRPTDGAGARRRRQGKSPQSAEWHYGAGRDLERLITTHLFIICPNNSGSTFLKKVLATCRATWNLRREGHWVPGYRGPIPGANVLPGGARLWAATQASIDRVTDTGAYDWPQTRRAWYFQAFAREPDASVFVTKSPAHLLVVNELARHFSHPRFLFMVRNPYAVCEGIYRYKVRHRRHPAPALAETAARHVIGCLDRQRENVQTYGDRGIFFTYEEMCAEPERVAWRIRSVVPELGDLNLRQRIAIRGRYDEMLTNMNARQIARLEPWQISAFNRVFRPHRALLGDFGYELMGDA